MSRRGEVPQVDPYHLNPLGLAILSELQQHRSYSYVDVARVLNVPRLDRTDIASWISSLRKSPNAQSHVLNMQREFYEARELIKHSSEQHPSVGVNKKNKYFRKVLDKMDHLTHKDPHIISSNGFIYRSSHGVLTATAKALGIKQQPLTELSRLARFDLKQKGKNPKDPYFKAYLAVIRKVAEKKLSVARLGKSPEDTARLRLLARRMEQVRDIKSLKILETVSNSWLSEIFIASIPILLKLYSSKTEITRSEYELLKRLSQGENIFSIGDSNEYGVALSELLKHLFLYGNPVIGNKH